MLYVVSVTVHILFQSDFYMALAGGRELPQWQTTKPD